MRVLNSQHAFLLARVEVWTMEERRWRAGRGEEEVLGRGEEEEEVL